jgi:hypothetical protein
MREFWRSPSMARIAGTVCVGATLKLGGNLLWWCLSPTLLFYELDYFNALF